MFKKWMLYGTLISILVILMAGCCQPPVMSSVPVNLIPQQRDWWCWAACTEMVSEYLGHKVLQCKSANFVHGTPPDCCTGCKGNCQCWGSAWGASITDIKNNWTHWNFTYTYLASSLAWEDLKKTVSNNQFCGKSPIYAVVSSHVVVIYGYSQISGKKYVAYRDPWPPNCQKGNNYCSTTPGGEDAVCTYEAFCAKPWWASFYNFKYTGS